MSNVMIMLTVGISVVHDWRVMSFSSVVHVINRFQGFLEFRLDEICPHIAGVKRHKQKSEEAMEKDNKEPLGD